MITSKDRAKLKSIIAIQSPVFQVGKDGLSENNIEGIKQVLQARELIKINILQNCDNSPREIADALAQQLSCEIVAVIGRKVVLYKLNPKLKTHVL